MGEEDWEEEMLLGSELGVKCGNQCEGILRTNEAHCFPLHRRKQAGEGKGLHQNHKDAGSPSSSSPYLMLSHRRRGWDSGSPSPSWEPLGCSRHKRRVTGVEGDLRKRLPGGIDGCRRPGLSLGVQP